MILRHDFTLVSELGRREATVLALFDPETGEQVGVHATVRFAGNDDLRTAAAATGTDLLGAAAAWKF